MRKKKPQGSGSKHSKKAKKRGGLRGTKNIGARASHRTWGRRNGQRRKERKASETRNWGA